MVLLQIVMYDYTTITSERSGEVSNRMMCGDRAGRVCNIMRSQRTFVASTFPSKSIAFGSSCSFNLAVLSLKSLRLTKSAVCTSSGHKNTSPRVRVSRNLDLQMSDTMGTGGAQRECRELVLELWRTFDSGEFSKAAALFTDDAKYYDTLYSKPFAGKDSIRSHFKNMERAFARNLRYVVDDIAVTEFSAGVRWHITLENGMPLPFSRGASTYKAKRVDGANHLLLVEAWDFPEPSLKAPWLLLPVLSVAVKLLRRWPQLLPNSSKT